MTRSTLVVDIGPLREQFYTGIPNVIAEICVRLLREDWLDLRFDMDGRWIDVESLHRCLDLRSGGGLAGREFRPAAAIREELEASGDLPHATALYTDHRPPHKVFPREGKLVYDLSMILAPECHPAESVRMYTTDLEQQIACSDVLFPISHATARDLAWVYGVPPERLRVVPLGNTVDPALPQRVRALAGGRAVEPFLLVLGSVEPRKNAGFVLEWAARHKQVLDRVRIVFAGRQAWGDSFESLVAAKGLDGAMARGRIVFTGFVDEREKAALLAGAAALLYPSVFEGFGLPLLEAMALGTPVLASVSTSMPEVVGDCAYVFDPCSIASLHAAFGRLWADRASGAVAETMDRARGRAGLFGYDAAYAAVMDGLFPGR